MKCNSRGSSLIETVIAVAIIGLIVGPFMLFFNQTVAMDTQTDETFEASNLAENYIEIIKKQSASAKVDDDGVESVKNECNRVLKGQEPVIPPSNDDDFYNIQYNHNSYKVKIQISKNSVDGTSNYHSVIVSVYKIETDPEYEKLRAKIENWILFNGS